MNKNMLTTVVVLIGLLLVGYGYVKAPLSNEGKYEVIIVAIGLLNII